jgi:rod shape determining protein RodA
MTDFSFKKLDFWTLGTIASLLFLSVAFIYSAKFLEDGQHVKHLHMKQLQFAAVGLIGYTALCIVDYKILFSWAPWIYLGVLVLLLAVFAFEPIQGARRWIVLPGPDLQPSELAKISTIIMLASYLGAPDRELDEWKTFFSCALIAGIPFVLIVLQPDLGTSLMLAPITLSLMLYAGVKRKVLLIGMTCVILAAAFACFWVAFERPVEPDAEDKHKFMPRIPFLEEYQKSRIRVFLTNDEKDLVEDEGWNKLQAQIAVGSGGLTGKGYLKGSQNILGFLPRTVAPTDFIFCVIAEETGFMGGVAIVALYSVLLGRCMRTAVRAREDFGRLMALGIGVMLFCHVFVNIAMTIGKLPITGLPLPLMSYGGSFMVSMLIALGLVQSIYLRRRHR